MAGLTLLLTPAANAATIDLTDVSGDVMTATLDDDGDVSRYNREGGEEGDIVFARVQHTATQVVIYMRYNKLSVPTQYAGYVYALEGNNGSEAFIGISTRHGKPQGDGEAASDTQICALSYRINYAGDSVSARIPRRCLHRAKYVRLTHISYRVRTTDTSDKIYYDSPTRDGGTVNQVVNSKTPWVVTG